MTDLGRSVLLELGRWTAVSVDASRWADVGAGFEDLVARGLAEQTAPGSFRITEAGRTAYETCTPRCLKCRTPLPPPDAVMLPGGAGPFPCYCWNGHVTERALRPSERRYAPAARRRMTELMAMIARGQCYDLERHAARHRKQEGRHAE